MPQDEQIKGWALAPADVFHEVQACSEVHSIAAAFFIIEVMVFFYRNHCQVVFLSFIVGGHLKCLK